MSIYHRFRIMKRKAWFTCTLGFNGPSLLGTTVIDLIVYVIDRKRLSSYHQFRYETETKVHLHCDSSRSCIRGQERCQVES
eukprot:scaffold183827_cov66-Cyclotella_meneghiniana.AAC.1